MSDGFKIADILNPETIRAYLNEMQQTSPQVAQQAAPPVVPTDVPVRYVPAPKVLHGTVSFRAVFTHEQLENKNYDMLRGMVMDVFADPNANNPWLPEISLNNIEMWEERVDDRPAERGGPGTAAIHGGVPTTGGFYQFPDADDLGAGIPDAPAATGQPIRSSLLRGGDAGGGGIEDQSRAAREAGHGLGGGTESGAGGSGWQPTFPASQEEDQEES